MMHHTSEYSHYRNPIDYKSFSKESYADEVATGLNSVDVKIVYLRRDNLKNTQGKRHLSFWREYFDEVGAGIVEVRNVR